MSETLGKLLVTRQLKEDDLALAQSLKLDIVCKPLLSFEFPEEWTEQIRQISTVKANSWIFTSKNGVLGFEELIKLIDFTHPDMNTFAVGKKTAGELMRLGYKPFIPEKQNAKALAELIIEIGKTTTAIHFCGNRRRKELSDLLGAAGIKLEEIEVYRTVTHSKSEIDSTIQNVAFYSPSAVEAYYKNRPVSSETKNFAIGPTTARALGYAGARNIIMADEPSTKALLQKVHEHLSRVNEN